MSIVAAIDPGKSGVALVASSEHDEAFFFPLPYDRGGHLRSELLLAFLQASGPDHVLIEKVQAVKGSGSTQTFNFGFAVGEVNALVTLYCAQAGGAARHPVAPQRWQKMMHAGIPAHLTAKERTMAAYERLFPYRPVGRGPMGGKPNDNVIDALMIMSFGMQTIAAKPLRPWKLSLYKEAQL